MIELKWNDVAQGRLLAKFAMFELETNVSTNWTTLHVYYRRPSGVCDTIHSDSFVRADAAKAAAAAWIANHVAAIEAAKGDNHD